MQVIWDVSHYENAALDPSLHRAVASSVQATGHQCLRSRWVFVLLLRALWHRFCCICVWYLTRGTPVPGTVCLPLTERSEPMQDPRDASAVPRRSEDPSLLPRMPPTACPRVVRSNMMSHASQYPPWRGERDVDWVYLGKTLRRGASPRVQ